MATYYPNHNPSTHAAGTPHVAPYPGPYPISINYPGAPPSMLYPTPAQHAQVFAVLGALALHGGRLTVGQLQQVLGLRTLAQVRSLHLTLTTTHHLRYTLWCGAAYGPRGGYNPLLSAAQLTGHGAAVLYHAGQWPQGVPKPRVRYATLPHPNYAPWAQQQVQLNKRWRCRTNNMRQQRRTLARHRQQSTTAPAP